VVVPAVFFIGLLGQQAAKLYPWAQDQVSLMRMDPHGTIENRLPAPLKKIYIQGQTLVEKAGLNPQEAVLRAVEALGKQASTLGASLLKNLVVMVFQTLIMIFALFFLFRDGSRLAAQVVGLIPMESIHKTHILNRLNETLTAVVRGMFVTASVQGLLAGIGFALIGVNFSVVLGFATALLALIPMIGAAAIWLPVGVVLFLSGEPTRGIIVLLYGAFIVSSVDNLLRPFIVGSRAKLPIALLFFGTLGGLQVYGPIGLLVGPLVVASVLAFAKIYAEQLARTGSKAILEPSAPPAASTSPPQ
jgi:predicted PurR-regulated permease PerM